MKKLFGICALGVGLGMGSAQAQEHPAAPAPAAPATVAPAVAPANAEETVTLTGTVQRQDKENGTVVYLFINKETGKRQVMPSNPRQLPTGVDLATFAGAEVTLTAVMLTREKDGKTQIIMKRITEIAAAAAAAPASAPASP